MTPTLLFHYGCALGGALSLLGAAALVWLFLWFVMIGTARPGRNKEKQD